MALARAGVKPLSEYKRKRNFAATPEPKPTRGQKRGHAFVVQRHWATREHFDLRLELNGVMVSWAVTRGPSSNPADKRLAVKVEDHPISYNDFEGTIPKGQYGRGTVMIWDRGTWVSREGDATEALRQGKMKIELNGERLKGGYALVRMKPDEKRENWLLIKERDEYATATSNLPGEYQTSVISGRARDEIAGGKTSTSLRTTASKAKVVKPHAAPAPSSPTAKAKSAVLPAYVKPMLCKLVDAPPEGSNWVHEEKYDGYRIQIVKSGATITLYSREGLDWTARFPAIAKAALNLQAESALIDGEAVVFDKDGITNFAMLATALKASPSDIEFMAFDVLFLNGKNLKDLPLLDRKTILKDVIPKKDSHIHLSSYSVGNGASRFSQSAAKKMEGIVSKRADSKYRSGRGDSWVKAKHGTREDVVVVGYVPSERGRPFGALLTAVKSEDALVYSGGVGTGFTIKEQEELLDNLKSMERERPPRLLQKSGLAPRNAKWVEPNMTIEVAMAGWSTDKQLRHARFLTMRNIDATTPKTRKSAPQMPQKPESPKSKSSKSTIKPEISHGDRIIFPDAKVTKQQIADYYDDVAELILPHLKGRPVSFVRAPESIAKETFFQRHALNGMRVGLEHVKDPEGKHDDFLTIVDGSGLRVCAQFGIVELHGWGSRIPKLENPDRVVFDLDPDEAVKFSEVKAAALQLRDMLREIGLISFPLVSGGKGLHVIAPLDASQDWEAIGIFTKGIARGLAESEPKRFVALASKERRVGKIYVDWLRNKMTATAIVPWSLRARPTASVAVPVTWEDVPKLKSAAQFTIKNHPDKNPWAKFFELKQRIPASTLEFLKARWF